MADEFDDEFGDHFGDEFDDEFDDFGLALDDNVLDQIDQIETNVAQRPVASSSKLSAPIPPSPNASARNASGPSTGARQMTLFGKPAAQPPARPAKVVTSSPGHISLSSQPTPAGMSRAAPKQWDRGAFLARERVDAQNKGRKEPLDFDSNDPPADLYVGSRRDFDLKQKRKFLLPPPPTTRELPELAPRILQLDREAAQTWVYPTNMDRRDYQYNIVQKALFNNVLVALPTGLGKTFIAAVVILNFFRWYPDGKILFLAPSRPLVDQQKIACHGICGLPWDCAVDLTGSKSKAKRRELWQSKRIFYMTPQTLENDICNESCDAREVVCVVVDEAHRSKGKYAYVNCIARLMEVNPFFRVLALSATPGKDSDSVQEVVDTLHINKIELRTEEALDVSPYMFRKREEIITVPLGRDLKVVKDNWAKLMRTRSEPLVKAHLLPDRDVSQIHPFTVSSIWSDPAKRAILAARPFLAVYVKELNDMTRANEHLQLHSVVMFYDMLRERSAGVIAKGKKAAKSKSQIYNHANNIFREIMKDLEEMQDYKGRIMHPKVTVLKRVLMDHFNHHKIAQMQNAEAIEESGRDVLGAIPQNGGQSGTRAIVFASYRKCCNEIVHYLHDCGLKATVFVGQSKDAEGNPGMTQKQQEAIITEFKAGAYDVLVATQIGEEGLDIGSVDVLVCYDSPKDPVRMLQRIGRTGRKRDGKVVVLTAEGKEESNWQHAKDNHRAVQKEVESLRSVSLFDDVERMIPDDIQPKAELKKVDQPLFDPSMVGDGKPAKTPKAAKGKQAAKKKDPKRNMPQGALEGFIIASALEARHDSSSSDSDQSVMEAQPQTHSQRMRRALQASSDEEDKENMSLSIGNKGKEAVKRPAKGRNGQHSSSSTAFCSTPPPDSSSDAARGKKKLGTRRPFGSAGSQGTCAAPQVIDDDEFDLSSALEFDPAIEAALQRAEGREQQPITEPEQSPSSSPVVMRVHRPHPLIAQIEADENLFMEDVEDDSDDEIEPASPCKSLMGPPDSVPRNTAASRQGQADTSSSSPIKAMPQRRARVTRPPSMTPSPTKTKNTRTLKRSRPLVIDDEDEDNEVAKLSKRPVLAKSKSKTAGDACKKASKGKAKLKKRKITNSPTSRALFQWEADRSTDEEVHGELDENDSGIGSSDEDDEDRAAVGDFMPTQAPKGYNQQSIYMQSMLSQAAPSEFRRLNHGPFPGIGGRFGHAPDDVAPATPHIRRPGVIPSSESRGRNETDVYSEDSFVVNDDEEIVWDSEPDALPNSSL